MTVNLASFPPGGLAVVFGASGAVGGAVRRRFSESGAFADVVGLSRSDGVDLTSEPSIADAVARLAASDLPIRLAFDATGFLHDDRFMPEKGWRDLDPARLTEAFAINAIGPALVMKHVLPLLPRQGKSVFATLSAKVGSIGDNQLGGWHSYRASKAALNQFVRTAAIELARKRPDAVCVALHPGTVDSRLSAPFSKAGLDVRAPEVAAGDLLAVIDGLTAVDTGGFFDYRGNRLPW
ncbi:SDR family oxidoreductase [Bauldia sp.]|uniref:SDR family oxidoreductase n=1 Tax=Bauldia sp. TaxID=2575872 RepID=UPI003BABF9A9